MKRAVVLALASLGFALSFASRVDARRQDDAPPTVYAVFLVDVSGSLSEAEAAKEQQTVVAAAQSLVAVETEVFAAVVEFASRDVDTDLLAARILCEFAPLETDADAKSLSQCVSLIAPREEGRGDDTNFVDAFETTTALFNAAPSGAVKLAFLLTDGKFDVDESERFGQTDPMGNAKRMLEDETLPQMAAAGVQLWTVGFGDADEAALRSYEAGAAPHQFPSCGAGVVASTSLVGASADDAPRLILETVAASTCSNIKVVNTSAPASEEFYVPAVASRGTIFVVTNSDSAEIRYFDPDGNLVPSGGRLSGEDFVDPHSGIPFTILFDEEGPVTQTLIATQPTSGTWRVEVDAPTGTNVIIGLTFTGEADIIANASPKVARPGDTVLVTAHLRDREGRVIVLSEADGVRFQANVVAAGSSTPIPLLDDGVGGDEVPRDGIFTGQYIVPASCNGVVTLVAAVDAFIVQGDNEELQFDCSASASLLPAITFTPIDTTWFPGDSRPFEFAVSNPGAPADLTVRLDPSDGFLPFQLESEVTTAGNGGSTLTFLLTSNENAQLGLYSPSISVVEVRPDGSERVIDNHVYPKIEVVARPAPPKPPPPTAPPTFTGVVPPGPAVWPYPTVAIPFVGALALGVTWRRKRRSESLRVRGLQVLLRSASDPLRAVWLKPLSPNAHRFPIRVDTSTSDFTAAAVGGSAPGDVVITRARNRRDWVFLEAIGQRWELRLGECISLGDDLEVGVNSTGNDRVTLVNRPPLRDPRLADRVTDEDEPVEDEETVNGWKSNDPFRNYE